MAGKSLRSSQKLSKLKLLDFDSPRHPWLQWRGWLDAIGFDEVKPQGILRFNQYDLVVQPLWQVRASPWVGLSSSSP